MKINPHTSSLSSVFLLEKQTPPPLLLLLSGVRVVAAFSADLNLQRRQVVQSALLHSVSQTLLFLFDHGTPHLLQRRVVFLLHLLILPIAFSVTLSPPTSAAAATVFPSWSSWMWRGGGRGEKPQWAAAARSAFMTSTIVISRAKSAPQPACRQWGGEGSYCYKIRGLYRKLK